MGEVFKSRCFFTDWLRSVACVLVLAVHGMVAVQRIIPTNSLEENISDRFIIQLLHFGMPTFFYLSGRAIFYSKLDLSVTYSYRKFIFRKLRRLIVPSFIGYFTVVALAAYLGSSWRPCAPKPPFLNIIDFYVKYLAEFKCSGLEWLWFLPMLFIILIINQPGFLYLKVRYEHIFKNTYSDDKLINQYKYLNKYCKLHVLLITSSVLIFYFLLGFPSQPIFCFVIPYIFIPIFIQLRRYPLLSNLLKYSFLTYLPIYIGSGFMAYRLDNIIKTILELSFNSQNYLSMSLVFDNEIQLRVILAIIFYNYFFIAGFLDMLLDVDNEYKRSNFVKNMIPVKSLILITMTAITWPNNKLLVTYLWAYPCYSGGYTTLLFVLGTWVWLEIFRVFGEELLQKVNFSPKIQCHFSQSCIVVYIIHVVWQEFLIRYIFIYIITPSSPYSLYDGKSLVIGSYIFPSLNFFTTWIMLICGSFILSMLTYIVSVKWKITRTLFGIDATSQNIQDNGTLILLNKSMK
ncbi:hypothetical protein cand_003160 [Cryptosporidium andersoni]|uniref:Acyltransferase 3 domain-containing protein n=1 Tax=Cryptosporidium andersoni TaxID=117008 RepID=A0A1J4MJ52_9CRYT|nr:hypothetical protein cand_003160 [Cryptosporidium andersoni]